jgi:hypothetical protein
MFDKEVNFFFHFAFGLAIVDLLRSCQAQKGRKENALKVVAPCQKSCSPKKMEKGGIHTVERS